MVEPLTVLVYIALFVLSELLRPKPDNENAKPASLGDFNFPTATEGRPVPLIWGTVEMKGPNVVWYGDLLQTPVTEKIKTGIFGSEQIVIGFQYSVGIQFGLCRGPVDSLRKVWIGEDLVFDGVVTDGNTVEVDEPELFGGPDLGNGGVVGTLRFFAGSAGQAPSSYLSSFQTEGGDTPGYTKTCYTVLEQGYVGNSTNIKPWSFELRRIPDGLGLGANALVNSNDANPVNVIYELLTDEEWGFAIDASDINTSNLTTAAGTLATEGNGFSFVMDRQMEASELLRLLEEQIGGVVYQNPTSGEWEVKLARADYTIASLRKVLVSNAVSTDNFSRGAWENTTNEVRVSYRSRADSYKETFAPAQDLANLRIQGGTRVIATENYPGVKDDDLASQIAWRDLKTLSFPLAKAKLILDRSFYDLLPGEVIAVTDPDYNLTDLPMRIVRLDMGRLLDNEIVVDVIQDIFAFQAGAFAPNQPTGWSPPSDTLSAFPADEQIVFEAPRAIVKRDPFGGGVISDRIWCGARKQGNEVNFLIVERHDPGTPSGDFEDAGEAYLFLRIGELASNLDVGSSFPLSTLLITPAPDSQAAIETEFTDGLGTTEVGVNLQNMILVNNEFMFAQGGAQDSGSDVQLNNVYRGVLDSIQQNHSAGDTVWLVFAGGSLTDVSFPAGDNVDIKLLPNSLTDLVAEASATTVQIAMNDRVRRPYPPSSIALEGTLWASSVSLEADGTGAESYNFDATLNRRDFRTEQEIEALTTDAGALFSDFPSANNTTHDVEVRNDPDGTNTLLFTLSGSSQDFEIDRIDILKETDGVLPTRMRLVARANHDVDGNNFDSLRDLAWDFDVTSALSGQFNFGALDTDETSNAYTVDAAGDHDFTLSSALVTNDVESRVNGGAWSTLIAGGSTTGSINGLSVADTVEIRHTGGESSVLKHIDMTAPATGTDGYGVLFS